MCLSLLNGRDDLVIFRGRKIEISIFSKPCDLNKNTEGHRPNRLLFLWPDDKWGLEIVLNIQIVLSFQPLGGTDSQLLVVRKSLNYEICNPVARIICWICMFFAKHSWNKFMFHMYHVSVLAFRALRSNYRLSCRGKGWWCDSQPGRLPSTRPLVGTTSSPHLEFFFLSATLRDQWILDTKKTHFQVSASLLWKP